MFSWKDEDRTECWRNSKNSLSEETSHKTFWFLIINTKIAMFQFLGTCIINFSLTLALLNVIFDINSFILVNRLKVVLHQLIHGFFFKYTLDILTDAWATAKRRIKATVNFIFARIISTPQPGIVSMRLMNVLLNILTFYTENNHKLVEKKHSDLVGRRILEVTGIHTEPDFRIH